MRLPDTPDAAALPPAFLVSAATAAQQDAIIRLILPIQQQEFGIAVTLAEQPDLRDIAGFYQSGAGNFWLAQAGNQVIGCIALKDIGNRQAALRKMFVASQWRGAAHGVAKNLLHTLIAWAQQQQLQQIYLGTTAQFLAAQRFYEKNGFVELAKEALPKSFPVMQVDSKFFCLQLNH